MAVAHPLSPLLLSQAMQVEQQLAPFSEAERPALALSEFMVESFKLYPQWWQHLHDCPPQPDEYKTYSLKLAQQLLGVGDEAGLMRVLRLYRRHMLARIAWMQALSLASAKETLSQLSELAETIIVAAREYLYRYCCAQWGTPCNAQGEPQPLLILGMGKLGGRELNFSSDIDLIFAYPENGMTQGGGREIENIQFFTRLGQRLIKVLDQPTIEGFVYRVDMRLRPFGDSGPLVLSFAALEDYYQEQGRDWERYAMVKARLMGEDAGRYEQELHNILRPFIFRRYIDFSVIQSLRNMKAMIAREVRRRVLHDNIKLGAGGIREIEFITQVFQLIRGGRERSLQLHSLLPSLQAISVLGLLTSEQVQLLTESYLFLRRLENLLQAINDEQTQTLPKDELNQNRLAWGMGCADWIVLRKHLEQHMQGVRTIFNQLIGDEEQEEALVSKASFSALWQDDLAEQDLDRFTPHLEVEARQRLLHCINDFHRDVDKRTIGNRGRDVLEQLMPILLAEVCAQKEAAQVLQCLTPLLLNIVTRTTYLELLQEYPAALTQLIRLCAASPMIASQLARHPLLLDELLDPNTLYRPMPQERYRDELRQYLMRIPEGDEEQHLEALRQFKHTQQLRIAAGDIAGVLPVMKVSDHLTYLAEAMIEAVVMQAWGQMVARYGQPTHLQAREGRGFAVLGYGKMGGWELGYGSDLDLVFLLDCPVDVMTDGVRSIDGRQFYLRLAQRVMHLFSTRTASGILYEVDARLRPSGASGMLVSTLEAFVDYQREEAWTWEHQALVRARPVYGDAKIHQQFAALRHEILCQFRDEEALKTEIREMREKMRHHQGEKQHALFNIKADIGGITDIEFIAQYLVLRYASREPRLTQWSDNVRIFELMANYHIMSNHEANALTHAYVTMRDNIHHLALQERSANVDPALFTQEREQVIASWHYWLSEDSGSSPLV